MEFRPRTSDGAISNAVPTTRSSTLLQERFGPDDAPISGQGATETRSQICGHCDEEIAGFLTEPKMWSNYTVYVFSGSHNVASIDMACA
jgi:hypothetical protein